MKQVSIFGLGKLGAVIAGCYASRGFQVVGVDVNHSAVASCDRGIPPVEEPGIEDLYRSAGELLSATMDGTAAVQATKATFIAVPTPSETDGAYSLKYVLEACAVIGQALRKKNQYHLVVLKSTVLPGASNGTVIPALEQYSGKQCGVGFGFCYNPEFIALGNVIHNIFSPDFTLIGESDPSAGAHLMAIHERLLSKQAPISRMNIVNAEITKLAVNTYVTMKISYANLLAGLCERLPDGNVDTVTAALGRDSRIGPKYIKGGLGYGGPCFPRDNAALLSLARQLGVSFPLAEATDQANQEIPLRVANLVAANAPPQGRIAVLGLSYKPDTPVIEESQSILIAKLLLQRGFKLQAYDPLAMEESRRELGDRVHFTESPQACIEGADIILLATPWKDFQSIDYGSGNSHRPVVIDCFGLLNGDASNGTRVVRLGVHAAQPEKLDNKKKLARRNRAMEKADVLGK